MLFFVRFTRWPLNEIMNQSDSWALVMSLQWTHQARIPLAERGWMWPWLRKEEAGDPRGLLLAFSCKQQEACPRECCQQLVRTPRSLLNPQQWHRHGCCRPGRVPTKGICSIQSRPMAAPSGAVVGQTLSPCLRCLSFWPHPPRPAGSTLECLPMKEDMKLQFLSLLEGIWIC